MSTTQDWKRGVMTGVAATALLLFGVYHACFRAAPVDPQEAARAEALDDSLQRVTDSLEVVREDLRRRQAASEDTVRRLMQQRARDVAKLRSTQAALDSARQTLAAPEDVPDTALRAEYRRALAQLDTTRRLVADQSTRIAQDSTLLAQRGTSLTLAQAEAAVNLRQRNDWEARSREWERTYQDHLKTRHPRCQLKCGVVIGVVGTVVTAWAVDRVQAALTRP